MVSRNDKSRSCRAELLAWSLVRMRRPWGGPGQWGGALNPGERWPRSLHLWRQVDGGDLHHRSLDSWTFSTFLAWKLHQKIITIKKKKKENYYKQRRTRGHCDKAYPLLLESSVSLLGSLVLKTTRHIAKADLGIEIFVVVVLNKYLSFVLLKKKKE